MKYFFTFLVSLLLLGQLHAQLVINEIMFSIPGTGEDEEYVEIFNASDIPIDVTGYEILDNSTPAKFPNVFIPEGGYLVVARDSVAFENTFGFSPDFEGNFSLSNSGEVLFIRNAQGILIDSVFYDDSDPWPSDAGETAGQSFQLCAPDLDNAEGSNWKQSRTTFIGVNNQSPADSLWGTPGAANNGECLVTGLESDLDLVSMTLNPNPAHDFVQLRTSKGINAEIVLYNMLGEVVKQDMLDGVQHVMSLSDLPKGMYIFQIRNESTSLTQRFYID